MHPEEGIKFITGEPALLVGKTLVVTDLHVGIEYDYYKRGITLPSQTARLTERLTTLIAASRARKLIIMGDVKHKVPGSSFQEERELPAFFKQMARNVRVEVLPGNHDADLASLVPDITIHPSKGILEGGCYLTHGHTWPGKEFLKAEYVLLGHDHPAVEFRDKLGYRWLEPVWARAALKKKQIMERYRLKRAPRLPELILVPTFNPFSGSIPLNLPLKGNPGLSPLTKGADMKKARIYLLDGTFLGTLEKL